jgi:hypothetical protein
MRSPGRPVACGKQPDELVDRIQRRRCGPAGEEHVDDPVMPDHSGCVDGTSSVSEHRVGWHPVDDEELHPFDHVVGGRPAELVMQHVRR